MLNMPLAQKRRIKGMTLLEVIIVLGIMGVIAAGVVVLAQRAIDSQNVTKLAQSLNTLQTGMIQSFRGKSSYPATATAADAAELGLALVSMGRASKADFANPFTGDDMLIYSFAANGVANKAFFILLNDLTQDQCRSLVSNAGDLFAYINVNSGVFTTMPTDIIATPNAAANTGVIKSPSGTGTPYDSTNLEHITALCGGSAGGTGTYSVAFGSR